MKRSFHRRNLPHLFFDEGIYFITYRLVNSIPIEKLEDLHKTTTNAVDIKQKRLFKKYDSIIDSLNYGQKYLASKRIADVVANTLHYPDGKDYKLICYTIMPNHVHLVFELLENNKGVSKIMQSIKRISARKCNLLLNRSGKFWQDESFDRLVRDDKELYFVIKYVLMNPVNAGLIKSWEEWKYSYCQKKYLVI